MSKLEDLRSTLSKAEEENPNEEYFTAFAPTDEGDTQKLDATTAKIQIGAAGLQSSGGVITEEWKPELTGGQAIKVYREMSDNDAIVGAILNAIQMLIRQVTWRAVPAESSEGKLQSNIEQTENPFGEGDEELGDEEEAPTGEEGADEGGGEEDEEEKPFGKADLRLAVRAYPRSRNKSKARSQIIRKARSLGALSMLPDTWIVKADDEDLFDTEEPPADEEALGDEEEPADDELGFDELGEDGEGLTEAVTTAAEENALFLKQNMNDMEQPWAETISEIMSMLTYGWSYHEIVYKTRSGPGNEDKTARSQFNDGKLGWRKMPIRAQDTLDSWEFDDINGDVLGMYQLPAPDYVKRYIPMEKALLFRTSVSKGNPEGKSILRNAYRSYVFKKRFEEIEGVGVERDLAGIPIAHVDPAILDPNASQAEKAILSSIQDIVLNIRRDTQDGVIWPRVYDENGNLLYELTLMGSAGGRAYDTGAIIDRYDRRMAQSVLADFIMMGHETVGSFALSSSKTRLFAVALGAWLDMITGVFNTYAVPKLFELNGVTEDIPTLTHTDLEIPDLNELADFVAKLAGVGIIFDDDAMEDHLRQIAKLPERPIGESRLREQIREAREQKELKQTTFEPENPFELRQEQYGREDQLRAEDVALAQLAEEEPEDEFPPR